MIAYEPHPVSPERKAELRAQGFKIIDARFAPQPAQAPEEFNREAVAALPRVDVLELLAAHGVTGVKGSLSELRARLAAIMFVDL